MYSPKYFDNQFIITQTYEIFDRTSSGKSWRRKPTETRTEIIDGRRYYNAVNDLWRGDRVEHGYTYAGYLPIKVSSISPNGARRAVWSYSFDLKR